MFSSDLGGLLSIALATVSIATLAGYGLLRGKVASLRDDLTDERSARASLQGRFDLQTLELADQQGKVKVLEGIVTGEIHWVALGDKLDEHHEEAKKAWTAQRERDVALTFLLTEIRDELRNR